MVPAIDPTARRWGFGTSNPQRSVDVDDATMHVLATGAVLQRRLLNNSTGCVCSHSPLNSDHAVAD